MSLRVDLKHRFSKFSLDLGFDVPDGITVLFGRSGSGKSTVLRAIAGIFKPDQARIMLTDRVLCDSDAGLCLPPHKRRIGMIFQDARLFPHLTVSQNLDFGRRFSERNVPQREVTQMVDMLGIGALLDRRPDGLSGGEQQRVAIGRALLSGAEMILADEPLAALDEARKAEILPYFERLRDEIGIPVLYVSHSPAEVARLATTVIALEAGQVIGQGSAEAVLGDPAVLPVGAGGAGALIRATVRGHHEDGLTELDAGGEALFLPHLNADAGHPVRLRIAAHEVILSPERPVGLSALNILSGTIAEISEAQGSAVLVAVQTGAGRVLARVTTRSVAALGLRVGAPCHAVVKTASIAQDNLA
ncbi:molybdenum ABC transporter ATP-binding protein [Celeribacter sp. PS-C1]|uniref:molybdenum ABC transporter ATP-binding protein n=1 Tax=Celeribacter sp. PS-C1 TaxID=2820813 RepID=UPI001CA4DF8D|nr:molybdenum ABC transporter ATP-binding protein [Celeribacter sp. PS-C1]MBW6416599.1 molybdenum ABC transporter ATP-binding protein [Celeribacter sp. PS-C1]